MQETQEAKVITRNRNQGRRLIRLLQLLQEEALSSLEISQRLGCTQQEVRRDLRLLEEEGLSIGHSGGRVKQYFLKKESNVGIIRDPVHALVIHAMLRLLHYHAPLPSKIYQKTALELAGDLPEHLHELAVLGFGKSSGGTPRELEILATAWMNREPVSFRYRKQDGEIKSYEGSVVYMNISRTNLDWYASIVVKGETEAKSFKVSRFTHVDRLYKQSSPDIKFDPKREFEAAWGIVGAKDSSIEVVLRFLPHVANIVKREPPERQWPGYIDGHIDEKGFYILKIKAATFGQQQLPLELLAWVRSWGAKVEVISPQNVREHWLSEAQELLNRYDT